MATNKENIHEGHRDRMKSEFLENGLENMAPHRILELLLFYCVPRCDTNPLAHELIDRYKTLAGVLDAPIEELLTFKGITKNNVGLLKMIVPLSRIYTQDKEKKNIRFNSIDDIGDYLLARFFGFTDEKFGVLCMDSAAKQLGFKIVSEGDLNSVGISTRNIIEYVLSTKATCIVIAHNHPSGIALPSDQDIAITEQVKVALSHIGVRLVDHIIIADNDYISLYQTNKYNHYFRGLFKL